jgi:hypothetical protein
MWHTSQIWKPASSVNDKLSVVCVNSSLLRFRFLVRSSKPSRSVPPAALSSVPLSFSSRILSGRLFNRRRTLVRDFTGGGDGGGVEDGMGVSDAVVEDVAGCGLEVGGRRWK